MISVMPIILSILHAALHAEGCRYGGEYSRQRLKNEFPSFVFHIVKELKAPFLSFGHPFPARGRELVTIERRRGV
jgi:hypothetical protein